MIIDLLIDSFINCIGFIPLVGTMVVNDKVRIEQRSGPTYCNRMAATNRVFLEKLVVPQPVKNPPRVTEPKLSLCWCG